jgi:hypothetical protein
MATLYDFTRIGGKKYPGSQFVCITQNFRLSQNYYFRYLVNSQAPAENEKSGLQQNPILRMIGGPDRLEQLGKSVCFGRGHWLRPKPGASFPGFLGRWRFPEKTCCPLQMKHTAHPEIKT